MNAVGIDVSKGKSTVAVLRPFGEIVASPFDVAHTFTEAACEKIYDFSNDCISSVSLEKSTVFTVIQAAKMLNSAIENCHSIQLEMNRASAQLPKYDTVMNMYGVGKAVGPQLIAEIGDPRRFHSRKAITAYFGYDSRIMIPVRKYQYQIQ